MPKLPDARWVATLLSAALLPLLAGCDSGGSPTAPGDTGSVGDQLTTTVESASYTFHLSPGDSVDVERQEAFHAWATAELGVSPPRLAYFKYRDRGQMAALTGWNANGWADPDGLAVHSVFPWHNHETVHVLTAFLGRPSDFFNEGIAVALSVDPLAGSFEPTYDGVIPVHDWARAEGELLLPLADLVTTSDFRSVDEYVGYQTAGSFVAYLIEEHGARRVGAFFAVGGRNDSRSRIEASFEGAFGVTLREAERRWHRYLGTGVG